MNYACEVPLMNLYAIHNFLFLHFNFFCSFFFTYIDFILIIYNNNEVIKIDEN